MVSFGIEKNIAAATKAKMMIMMMMTCHGTRSLVWRLYITTKVGFISPHQAEKKKERAVLGLDMSNFSSPRIVSFAEMKKFPSESFFS